MASALPAGFARCAGSRQLEGTHRAVKTAMRWTGASERMAKNWIAGSHGPSGEHLISLLRHSDEVLIGLLIVAGRGEAIVAVRLVEMRDRLEEARQMIDVVLDREGDGEGRTSGPS